MKIKMKTNIRKIATLVLAISSLVTLLSLMPEHSSAYNATHGKASPTAAIANN